MSDECVFGIDPGYGRAGFALLTKERKPIVLHSECMETDPDNSFEKRLHMITSRMFFLIDEFAPSCVSIEGVFFHKNRKTAIDVAGVRGALLYCAEEKGVPVFEYTPLQVKTAVTGDGRADKEQMEKMIYLLTALEKEQRLDDEIDAIAIGITHIVHTVK